MLPVISYRNIVIGSLSIIFALLFIKTNVAQDVNFFFRGGDSGIIGEVDNSAHRLRAYGIEKPHTSRYIYFLSNDIPLSGIKTTTFEADVSLPTGLRHGTLGIDSCGDSSGSDSMGTPVLFRISFPGWTTFVEISMQSFFGLALEQVFNGRQQPPIILSSNCEIARTYTQISGWTGGEASFDPLELTDKATVGVQFHVRLSIDFEQDKVMAEVIPKSGFEKLFNPIPPGIEGIVSPLIAIANLVDYTKSSSFNGNFFYIICMRTNGNTDVDNNEAPGGTLRYIDREFTNIRFSFNQPIAFPKMPELQTLFFPDDFNDSITAPYWTSYPTKGLDFVEEEGVLRINGLSSEEGYSNFMTNTIKRRDITVEMDFKAVSGIQANTSSIFRIQFDPFNYFEIDIYSGGYNLVRVIENQVDAVGIGFPPFGDEATNWHRLKLVYQDSTGHVEGFIDNIQLGGIIDKVFPSSFTTLQFASFVYTVKDQYVEYQWDNFTSTGKDLPTFQRWDINQDGKINILDLVLASKSYGKDVIPLNPNPDVNGDGKVDMCDFILIIKHFGE